MSQARIALSLENKNNNESYFSEITLRYFKEYLDIIVRPYFTYIENTVSPQTKPRTCFIKLLSADEFYQSNFKWLKESLEILGVHIIQDPHEANALDPIFIIGAEEQHLDFDFKPLNAEKSFILRFKDKACPLAAKYNNINFFDEKNWIEHAFVIITNIFKSNLDNAQDAYRIIQMMKTALFAIHKEIALFETMKTNCNLPPQELSSMDPFTTLKIYKDNYTKNKITMDQHIKYISTLKKISTDNAHGIQFEIAEFYYQHVSPALSENILEILWNITTNSQCFAAQKGRLFFTKESTQTNPIYKTFILKKIKHLSNNFPDSKPTSELSWHDAQIVHAFILSFSSASFLEKKSMLKSLEDLIQSKIVVLILTNLSKQYASDAIMSSYIVSFMRAAPTEMIDAHSQDKIYPLPACEIEYFYFTPLSYPEKKSELKQIQLPIKHENNIQAFVKKIETQEFQLLQITSDPCFSLIKKSKTAKQRLEAILFNKLKTHPVSHILKNNFFHLMKKSSLQLSQPCLQILWEMRYDPDETIQHKADITLAFILLFDENKIPNFMSAQLKNPSVMKEFYELGCRHLIFNSPLFIKCFHDIPIEIKKHVIERIAEFKLTDLSSANSAVTFLTEILKTMPHPEPAITELIISTLLNTKAAILKKIDDEPSDLIYPHSSQLLSSQISSRMSQPKLTESIPLFFSASSQRVLSAAPSHPLPRESNNRSLTLT